MAHGFLSPQEVSGESPLWKDLKKGFDKLLEQKIFPLSKQQKVIETKVEEIQNLLKQGEQKKLPPAGQKLLGGASTKLLMGSTSSAIVPRKAGIVNTEVKNAIVGRNATDIDRKEQKYLGTADPDVAGGPRTRKGGTFSDFGSTTQAKPLNNTNFFSKAVNEGIDASTGEYLSREARIAAFQKGRVARNPDQGPTLSPDSGADIVAAVNRNTEAIVALAALTKDQTSKQVFMHNEREARDERRANRALARAEERDLERGRDRSGYLTPERFKRLPPAGGTGGGGGGLFGGFDGGDVAKTLGRRLLGSGRYTAKGAQTAAKTAKAITGPKALLAASKLGVTTPAHIARMIGKNSGKISGIASRMVLGSTKAAPIVKTMVSGAKATKPALAAIAGAATGAKAMQAGADATTAARMARKKGFSLKNFGEAMEVDGVRQLGNIAATGDDAVDGAKMLARLVDEGVPKTQAAKIVADQFPAAGKVMSEGVTSTATAKLAGKALGKGVGKSLLKKIPVIAGLAGIAFGIQRAMEGDFLGAGLEIASGVMGATGVGAGASLGIDGFLLARDMGVTPFAQGGIITKPTMGLVGETGQAEGVFPLEGAQGRKTFEMFGNAFVDAQKKRKKEVAQVQLEGFRLFAKEQEYMKVFDLFNPFNWGGGNNGGNSGGSRSTSPMVGPPPPVSGGSRGGTPLNSTGAKGVLDVIASVESNGSYDVFNTARGGTPGKATEKTIGWLAKNAQGAIGRYQHMPEFILERAARFGYDANTRFTPEVQDDITIKMMQEQHGLDDFLSGNMSAAKFAAKLAPTWRGLPQGQRAANRLGGTADSTYMDQYSSGNKAHMSWQDSVSNFERIQAGAGKIPQYDPSKKYKAGDMVIKNGEVREFDGMGWARPSGVSAQNFEPQASNPTTGTPLMATSAQVASAATAPAAAPTIINNYYTGGQQQNGVNPNGVTAGIGMQDSGTAVFQDLRIRSLA